jgi:hypothetical protein
MSVPSDPDCLRMTLNSEALSQLPETSGFWGKFDSRLGQQGSPPIELELKAKLVLTSVAGHETEIGWRGVQQSKPDSRRKSGQLTATKYLWNHIR